MSLFDLDQGQLVAKVEVLEARLDSLASINCEVETENDRLHAEIARFRRCVDSMLSMVDQTDPNDPIGVALTHVGLTRWRP